MQTKRTNCLRKGSPLTHLRSPWPSPRLTRSVALNKCPLRWVREIPPDQGVGLGHLRVRHLAAGSSTGGPHRTRYEHPSGMTTCRTLEMTQFRPHTSLGREVLLPAPATHIRKLRHEGQLSCSRSQERWHAMSAVGLISTRPGSQPPHAVTTRKTWTGSAPVLPGALMGGNSVTPVLHLKQRTRAPGLDGWQEWAEQTWSSLSPGLRGSRPHTYLTSTALSTTQADQHSVIYTAQRSPSWGTHTLTRIFNPSL